MRNSASAPWRRFRCATGGRRRRDTLEAFLRTALAAYKVPRDYVVLPQIPRSDSGKLLRRVARARYLEQRAMA
jgi:acyl-CoA synthetase (AMP-forming)/AMP-acid ligase II